MTDNSERLLKLPVWAQQHIEVLEREASRWKEEYQTNLRSDDGTGLIGDDTTLSITVGNDVSDGVEAFGFYDDYSGSQASLFSIDGVGDGVFSGTLLTSDGAVGAVAHGFSSDPDTGAYSGGADVYNVGAGGVLGFSVAEAGAAITSVSVYGPLMAPNGAVGAPSLAFTSDPDTGVYSGGADVLALGSGGVLGFSVTEAAAAITLTTYGVLVPNATLTQDLGTSSARFGSVYSREFNTATHVMRSGSTVLPDLKLADNHTGQTTSNVLGVSDENIYATTGAAAGTYIAYSMTPTITQTGGGTGITRGLYINPTLTNAANWRAIEIASGGIFTTALEKRRTATQAVTDSTTLTADNTLVATVAASRAYRYRVEYYFTTVNTSGIKVDMGGGTATITSWQGSVAITNLASYAGEGDLGGGDVTTATTSRGVTASGTKVKVVMEGTFVVNAAGTIIPRFAQNAETGASENATAFVNSTLFLDPIL